MAQQHQVSKRCLNCKSIMQRDNFFSDVSFTKTKYCSDDCRKAASYLSRREFRRRQKAERKGLTYNDFDGLKEMLTQNLKCSFQSCNAKSTTFFDGKSYCLEHFKELKKALVWDWNDNKYVKKHRPMNWRARQ